MIIPITSEPGKLPEWAIVELQGDLEAYQKVVDPEHENFIGDLHYLKGDGNCAILIIGMHILHGKEVELPKPLGVIMKKEHHTENNTVEWSMKALVRKKLIFKTRPRPIVTDVPKSI